MRDVAGFGSHRCDDFGQFEEVGMRLDKEQLGFGTSFKIEALRFVESIVRVFGFGEAFFEQHDERKACFAQGAGYLLLALGDSCGDEDGAVGGIVEALVALGSDLGGRKAARALKNGAHRTLGEEYVAKRGARDAGYLGLLVDAEEIRVSALEPEPAGVIVDIVNHPPKLAFLMENTIVIARGDGFPYAVTARKNASKMLDALCCSLLIAHFGDIIVAGDIHPFVSCGTRAFETAYHIAYALWQQLLHVQYYMDMIRHNLRCKDFDGVAFTRVEMRQVL